MHLRSVGVEGPSRWEATRHPLADVWRAPDPLDTHRALWATRLDAARTPPPEVGATVAAVAAHLPRRRASGLAVAADHGAIEISIALADAHLELSCWFRTLDLGAGTAPNPSDGSWDDPVDDLPLPHRHGARWSPDVGLALWAGSGVGLVGPLDRPGGTLVVDSIVGATRRDLIRVLATVTDHALANAARRLVAVVGAGEPHLDDLLADRGFERTTDWWWLPFSAG